MFSRIARASNLISKPSVLFRCVSTSSANKNSSNSPSTEVRRYPHDAPERDFVNFPPLRVPEEGGKVRIGLVPDEWFKAMYDKTGVTGPYILFWGAVATILSKEYFVFWVDTQEQIVIFGTLILASKLYGKKIADYLDKGADEANKAAVSELETASKAIDAKISENEALQSLPEVNKIIHAAKRESIHMQLEAALRSRLAQVFAEVKKRLDYQVAIQSVYKRLERDQAINYIIGEVNKAIGPNLEKEAFQSGLSQLKLLAQKHAGTI